MCASRIVSQLFYALFVTVSDIYKADAGAFPALLNTCLPPNTDVFTGWLWETVDGPSWTFEYVFT